MVIKMKLKIMQQIKLNRIMRRSNDFIENIICYPINKINKYFHNRNRTSHIYNFIDIKKYD